MNDSKCALPIGKGETWSGVPKGTATLALVLFHDKCVDGYTSYYNLCKSLDNTPSVFTVGAPCVHGVDTDGVSLVEKSLAYMLETFKSVDGYDTYQTAVYILDYSFDDETLSSIAKIVDHLICIDHHVDSKTGEPIRCSADNKYVVFDNERSGALLCADYFGLTDPAVLALAAYVDDRDRWIHALPYTKEVSSYISLVERNAESYNELVELFREDPALYDSSSIVQAGTVLLKAKKVRVAALCDTASLVSIADHLVPSVNTSVDYSDVGHELLRRYPDAPFSITYYEEADGSRKNSLRSRSSAKEGDALYFDCNAFAKIFNGGGHTNAAGFLSPGQMVIDRALSSSNNALQMIAETMCSLANKCTNILVYRDSPKSAIVNLGIKKYRISSPLLEALEGDLRVCDLLLKTLSQEGGVDRLEAQKEEILAEKAPSKLILL